MSERVLTYEVTDHVGVITLNRPEAMNLCIPEERDRPVWVNVTADSGGT